MSPTGRTIAIVGVIALVVVAGGVRVRTLASPIPSDAASTVVARTQLQGEIAPDASGSVDPAILPRSPVGQECLTTIERPAGPLSVCWEAYRDPFDSDPVQDYYRMRVYGTFGGETGTGVRWVVVRARLLGKPSNNVFEAWPDGVFEGSCREVQVSLHSGGPPETETLCGQTTGISNLTEWGHRVEWTCHGCLIPDHADRAIALLEFVAVPAGTMPSWEIFADLGS